MKLRLLLLLLLVSAAFLSKAQNPLIQTKYPADPTPLVYRDTVFLYTSHDEDDAKGFKMYNWLLYTSTDMVNWTDHGTVASTKSFNWSPQNGAWTPFCVARNGGWCSPAKSAGKAGYTMCTLFSRTPVTIRFDLTGGSSTDNNGLRVAYAFFDSYQCQRAFSAWQPA